MNNTHDLNLNESQTQAVTYNEGPLLIIAGAGTGKTHTVVEKIKYLLSHNLAKTDEILALTFTEKAAREMENRVDIALPYGTYGMWIMTFHSFCDRILRDEAMNIGLSPGFKLMTDTETILFIKQNFWKFKLVYYRPHGNPYKFIEGLIQHFDRLKDEDVGVEEYLKFAKDFKTNSDEEKQKIIELAQAYATYEDLKQQSAMMDFSDLIGNTLRLFRTRKAILAQYQKQFKYILIDEFQDTNLAQYQLIKLLAPTTQQSRLTVVGDDSQSIYKFRGAAISNILHFMKDYSNAKQIVLTTCYRCPQPILDSAYQLIKNNDPNTLEAQLGISKNLIAANQDKTQKIEVLVSDRVENEADSVTNAIKNISLKQKKDYKDFAILVRANNHAEPFIRSFERLKIPYQFLGPGALFHQPEVVDLICYLKVLNDFTDSVSLYRVLAMDIWGISNRDIIAILSVAKKKNYSLFEQLEKISEINLVNQDTKDKVQEFVSMIHRHQDLIPKETAGQILYYFLLDSQLLKKITNYTTVHEEKIALNITKFFDRLKSFEASHKDASVFATVEYLDLALDSGESPTATEVDWSENNAVNILTVHSAKGLEFPVVFLVNLIEGRFPSRSRKEKIPIPTEIIKEVLPTGDYHLQEERRLFYVGMTRAQEKLFFTSANYYGEGKKERKLSPFINESLQEKWDLKIKQAEKSKQIPLFEWAIPSPQNISTVDLAKPITRVDYLSYSAIESFKVCPLHYKLRYILKIPTPPTASQSLGTSIHQTLRDFYKSQDQTITTLHQLLKTNWINEGYKSTTHEKDSFAKAQKYLETYLKSDLHLNSHPFCLEQGFNFRIDPNLKILGKIDRVDNLGGGKIEIIDYKTGANIPSQKDIDNNLQMTLYCLAAINPGIFNKTIDQVKMSFYYFETATKMSTQRTMTQLNEAKESILKIKNEIESSDFQCSHSILCNNCEYKMLCIS